MIPNLEQTQTQSIDQGKDLNWVKEWALELIRWSRDKHEKEWCADNYIYYRHYKNYVNQRIDPDDYRSNIGVGLAYPIVKIISAMLMAPWQAGDSIMDAHAYDAAGLNSQGVVGAYINDHFVNRIKQLFSRLEIAKECGVALGRGVVKPVVRWDPKMTLLRRVTETIGAMVKPGGFPGPGKLMYQDVPARERLSVEYVDPFNFWWMGSSRWAQEAEQTIEESYITSFDAWKRKQTGEFNVKKAEILDGDAMGYNEYTLRRHQLNAYGGDIVRANQPRAPQPHRLHEIQGWIETRQTKNGHRKYVQGLVQLIDEKQVVVSQKLDTWNGKPSYIVWEPWQDFASERSIGVIEPMEQILLILNDFVNIALDNARLSLESPMLADPGATDQKELYYGPGETNWFRNPTASVAPLPHKDLPRSFFDLIGFFNDLIQRVTGVSDYFGGMNTMDTQRLTKTAKGMELMTSLATKRFSPLLSKMDYELYRPLAEWIHQTAKLRLQDHEAVPTPWNANNPFTMISPAQLDNSFRYTFNAKALDMATGRRRQEFIEMMGLLNQMFQSPQAMQAGQQIDLYEAARILMDEFDRDADIERLIKVIPQMPAAPGGAPVPTPAAPLPAPGSPAPPPGALPPPGAFPRTV